MREKIRIRYKSAPAYVLWGRVVAVKVVASTAHPQAVAVAGALLARSAVVVQEGVAGVAASAV